jgi:CheY-like chemotaxis protein
MGNETVLLFAEDNPGHFALIESHFARMGVMNRMLWFQDGQEILDFFFNPNGTPKDHGVTNFVLFLDINMPKIDGLDVLKRIKQSESLKKTHVIMLTTTDDHEEIELCYNMGCSAYIVKPLKYSCYIDAMKKAGLFPTVVANGVKLRSKWPA